MQRKKHIHLAAGKHVTFRVSEKVPVGFTPGTYFAVATVDPANTFAETNLADKTAISANTLTVQSLYPNVLGTYVGSGIIKKGIDKGLTFTQSVTSTSEDNATGIIIFNGTDLFANGTTVSFSGQTIVKPNGSYTSTGTDVPEDVSGVIKLVGKYTGNKSKGSFTTAINSGTFSDTLEG